MSTITEQITLPTTTGLESTDLIQSPVEVSINDVTSGVSSTAVDESIISSSTTSLPTEDLVGVPETFLFEDGWNTIKPRAWNNPRSTIERIVPSRILKRGETLSSTREVIQPWKNSETDSTKKPLERKTSIDLVKSHFDGFNSQIIWNASHYLLSLVQRGAEAVAYTRYFQSVDFVKHLQDKHASFFHQVVSHRDRATSTKIALYDWTYKGRHIYIVTSSPWSRPDNHGKGFLAKKHSVYNKLVKEYSVQSETNPDAIVLSDEGFAKLRFLALKDIAAELMKLQFFEDYSLASAAVQIIATERVQFTKKLFEKKSFESKTEDLIEDLEKERSETV